MTRRSATRRRLDATLLTEPARRSTLKPAPRRHVAAPTIVKTTPASFRRRVVALIEEEKLATQLQWEYGLRDLPNLRTPFWQQELERRRHREHRKLQVRTPSRLDNWGASGASVAEALATGVKLNTTVDERQVAEQLATMEHQLTRFADGGVVNLTPFLELLFQLNGKPFHIRDHFLFEPFFTLRMCRSMLWKTGRQVAKSTSQAVQGILCSLLIPYFNTLFVTPLYEMIRRFSVNYVKPFIDNSFIRNLLIDGSCMNNVLQRTFRNQSTMFFSFALLDANRTRGLNCAKNAFDEAQDMDPANLPIIKETMSASKWNITQMTGTPKTLEGVLEQEWLKSSQSEWIVPCDCGHYNVPSLERDLDAMLGPTHYDREVSERAPGVVCAQCNNPINPRGGFWYHFNEKLRYKRDGRHVPQCLLPMHYADDDKWAILIGKREGWGNTPKHVFYNECCGESYDAGARMLTVTDIKRAATLHENRLEAALATKGNYVARALGVDWGGGGKDWTSFTTAAVLGMRYDGRVDVIYGWRSLRPHAYFYEASYLYRLYQDFECELAAHDFTGWGALREDYLNKAGVPLGRLWPISYIRTSSGAMMRQVPLDMKTGKRMHFQLDKARSLMYTFELIKKGFIHTFAYDHHGDGREGLLHDLLNMVADKVDSRTGSELFTIIRDEKAGPDDFAHSVNLGTMALFMSRDHWPDVGILRQYEADEQLLEQLSPADVDFDFDYDAELN